MAALSQALPALAVAQSCLALSAFEPLKALSNEPVDFAIDLKASSALGVALVVVAPRVDRTAILDKLSPRRREVALLLAQGFSNRRVAAVLGITLATVKDHVHAVLDSLGLASRAELIAALHSGPTRR